MNRTRITTIGLGLVLLSAVLALVAPPAASAGNCISGTVVASASDQPSMGLYKYRVTMTWGPLTSGLSHWDLWLGQMECSHLCSGASPLAFISPAGTGTGLHGDSQCTGHFNGSLQCNGDQSISLPGPLVEFDAATGENCTLAKSGTAIVTFYSNWPPGPSQTLQNVLTAKFGNAAPCSGPLTGPLPVCTSAHTANESSSWGGIKGIYK